MRKVLAVIRREFVERVRQKWFWAMAVLGPLFFGALFILPTLLIGKTGVKHIAVVDGTTSTFGAILTARLNVDTALFVAVRVVPRPGTIDSLRGAVDRKEIDGFLIIGDAAVDSGKAMYRASNVSSPVTIGSLDHIISETVNAARLEREGVNPTLVQKARIRVDLDSKKISGGKETGESAGQSFALAYFMGIILYMSILLYGINVMSSVLEEKTTKIVEVLVSSLRPFQLLLGKVLGVGAVSIFQFLIWGVSTRLLLSQRRHLPGGGASDAGGIFQMPHVTASTAVVFGLYFLGGFLLYSAMFSAVGAMSSNEQEARQAQQPVVMLLVASFISMFAMLNDPGSTLSVTLSMIPFSAPIAMPVRWAAGNLPIAEVALSLGILAVSILGVTWVASRIYRVGILMTGKRPSIKELVRWVRTA
ncbi:MAG TPA: ABC transporter permease [Gemmatimonadales bacterium]|nr:ABC transporter permease [Gemmatimonadales bacterium]